MKIFTFWEPKDKMPDYLKLCMETWKKFLPDYEIVVLDYTNIAEYIDITRYNKRLFDGTFSLPQIADALRAMLLEEHGGIWMDTDTIILGNNARDFMKVSENVTFFGLPDRKLVHIGWINARPHARLMQEWVKYNKDKIENFVKPEKDFWAYLGNAFVNPYIQNYPDEATILDKNRANIMPEFENTPQTYQEFYFNTKRHLNDINTSLLCLHNSWTPKMFKEMPAEEFLSYDCTLSNILSEVLEKDVKKTRIYNSAEKENKYILHKTDGSSEKNPIIPGLNVKFTGKGGIVEIYEPCNHFELSNIICGTNSHIIIKGSKLAQKTHGLNINANAKNNFCYIGSDFTCWNIWITLIDEAGLGVEIGDDCMFSQGIELRPSDAYVIFERSTKKKLNSGEKIVIGKHVWVGKNVNIGKGAVIPDNTVIASFSKVVRKFKSEYTIIGGYPAKILRSDIDWDRIHPDLWEDK